VPNSIPLQMGRFETTAVEPPPIEQPAFSAASCARMSPSVGTATEIVGERRQGERFPFLRSVAADQRSALD
jgi:hypothetical protein